MSVELWVDDVKPPRYGVTEWCKTYEEAFMRLRKGDVDVLYLDYDLGSPGCRGDALLRELVERGGKLPATVRGISANQTGNQLIDLTVAELRGTSAPPEIIHRLHE